jgi:hypothetical protein
MKFLSDKRFLRQRLSAWSVRVLVGVVSLCASQLLAQQTLTFRSHDFRLGFFYEAHGGALYVYRDRAAGLGNPILFLPSWN